MSVMVLMVQLYPKCVLQMPHLTFLMLSQKRITFGSPKSLLTKSSIGPMTHKEILWTITFSMQKDIS